MRHFRIELPDDQVAAIMINKYSLRVFSETIAIFHLKNKNDAKFK